MGGELAGPPTGVRTADPGGDPVDHLALDHLADQYPGGPVLRGAGYRSTRDVTGLPPRVADAARPSLAAAGHLGGPVAGRARAAFVDGTHLTRVTATAVTAAPAAVAVTLLLRRPDSGR
ncbi:hypothetical protein [Kitasatospora sp. NPDC091207]|uniref:hypothetical protein n=1 Tax=Kitasatospora sp. NPDC091207 TaxID=3364083 RepID=UPI003829B05C